MFPVCITGCGHIMYSVVPVTGLSQAWWYMNCLWFYATKRPLGTIRRSMDCLPSGFVRYIHRRRYTSVVYIYIDYIYATKGDIKHSQLNPSKHCIPKYILPLTRAITRLTSLTHMYKKNTPLLITLYAHTMCVQSLNWADDCSSKLFETKSPMGKHLETKFPIERALASR